MQNHLVQDILPSGPVEPSDSVWLPPTILVTKKDGGTDYVLIIIV
jgi:hypothetical protein